MTVKHLVSLPGGSISASRAPHHKLRVWTSLGIYLIYEPVTSSSQYYLVTVLVVMAPLVT